MAKRQTLIEKAIERIDEQIAALFLARAHLLEQQAAQAADRKSKPATE